MNKSVTVKVSVGFLLMGLITVGTAQAGFAPLGVIARLAKNRKMIGMAVAAVSEAKVVETVSAPEKASEKKPSEMATKKLTFEHPLDFDENGAAKNFGSEIYIECQEYDSEGSINTISGIHTYNAPMLHLDEIKNDGSATEPIKVLSTAMGTYTFDVGPGRVANVQFEYPSNGWKKTMKEVRSYSVWMGSKDPGDFPRLRYTLRQGESSFSHKIAGIPSQDGTRVILQATIKSEGGNPSRNDTYVFYVELFTPTGCLQNYHNALAAKETTEAKKETYMRKCLRTPIQFNVPEGTEVREPVEYDKYPK